MAVAPSQTAKDAYAHAVARKNLFEGAVRSSKTNTSLLRWAYYAASEAPEGYPLLMAGRTFTTLRDNVLSDLQGLVGEDNFRFSQNEGQLFGRKVLFRGADKAGSEAKIRGATFAGAYLDEKTLLDKEFCKQVGMRMSLEGAREYATTNPDSPHHWLKKEEIDRQKEFGSDRLRVFHFELKDNPSLPQFYVQQLDIEYVGLWHDRFVKGKWVVAEGSVYPFFQEALHVIPGPPCKADYYTVSIDYGTSDATCFQLFGHMHKPLPGGLTCWLEAEYYWDSRLPGNAQKTDTEYADDFKLWLGNIQPRYIIVDPSAASFKLALIRKNYRQVRNARNAVVDGIRTQARMLKSGAFKLCAGARQSIEDYGYYVWDEKAQQRGEDKPMHNNSHTLDTTRYCLNTIYGRML